MTELPTIRNPSSQCGRGVPAESALEALAEGRKTGEPLTPSRPPRVHQNALIRFDSLGFSMSHIAIFTFSPQSAEAAAPRGMNRSFREAASGKGEPIHSDSVGFTLTDPQRHGAFSHEKAQIARKFKIIESPPFCSLCAFLRQPSHPSFPHSHSFSNLRKHRLGIDYTSCCVKASEIPLDHTRCIALNAEALRTK